MKKIFSLILLYLAGSYFCNGSNLKVLFIGNSYVGTNSLPQVYYQLALSGGDTVFVDSNSPGGYTFNQHRSNSTTLSKINSQDWDFVILQEQSQLPSFPPSQVATDVYPYARILDSLITDHYPCSKTLFFMTWGRKYGDASNCPNYPPLCTYAGMQQRLRESYLEMASNNLAMVAPVGAAFARSMSLDSTLNLYNPDNSHPSIEGTYLAACVFYASTFQSSPMGLSYHFGLSPGVAGFLQQVAHEVVLDSLSTWNLNPIIPQSSFSSVVNGNTVTFSNTGLNGRNFEWNFGDGFTSALENPQHTYNVAGNYNVQLISSLRCNSDTSNAIVTIGPTHIAEENQSPKPLINSNSGQCYLSNLTPSPLDYFLYDVTGRLIASGHLAIGEDVELVQNSGAFELLYWQNQEKRGVEKIVVH